MTREFVPCPDFIQLKDISHWKERMPISAANSYDSAFPPLIKYNSEPSPQVGVTILHESGFQVHCDCKASAINIGAVFKALDKTTFKDLNVLNEKPLCLFTKVLLPPLRKIYCSHLL